MEACAKQMSELLKTLANENRLIILGALMKGPTNVSDIAKWVPDISKPALSQHLSILKAHGILDSQKVGMNTRYSIADKRVLEIIDVLKRCYY